MNQHEAALVLAQLAPDAAVDTDPADATVATGTADVAGSPAPTEPDEMVRALQEQGIASVVLTLGAEGARVADADGIHRIPPAPVDAVDTTGAGDAFIGALALGLARGDDLPAAARLASRVGAYAATGEGAQPSYPDTASTLPPLAGS